MSYSIFVKENDGTYTDADMVEYESFNKAISYAKSYTLSGLNILVQNNQTGLPIWKSEDSEALKKYMEYSADDWNAIGYGHHQSSDKPSVYFDIDGTLGYWYQDARGMVYPDEVLDPNTHYFRNIEPHSTMIELAEKLTKEGYDVCVISAADKNTMRDKMEWVEEYCPFIAPENVCFCPIGANKSDFVKGNADISVLIDDYNKNLDMWEGMGIKAINTINTHQKKYQEIRLTEAEERPQNDRLRTMLVEDAANIVKQAVDQIQQIQFQRGDFHTNSFIKNESLMQDFFSNKQQTFLSLHPDISERQYQATAYDIAQRYAYAVMIPNVIPIYEQILDNPEAAINKMTNNLLISPLTKTFVEEGTLAVEEAQGELYEILSSCQQTERNIEVSSHKNISEGIDNYGIQGVRDIEKYGITFELKNIDTYRLAQLVPNSALRFQYDDISGLYDDLINDKMNLTVSTTYTADLYHEGYTPTMGVTITQHENGRTMDWAVAITDEDISNLTAIIDKYAAKSNTTFAELLETAKEEALDEQAKSKCVTNFHDEGFNYIEEYGISAESVSRFEDSKYYEVSLEADILKEIMDRIPDILDGHIVSFDTLADLYHIADFHLYADKEGHQLLSQHSIYGDSEYNVPVTAEERQSMAKIVEACERSEKSRQHRADEHER